MADYRIVESAGATEGAPAAGAAELVVDITTTGATLAANGLKVLADGLILKSQAQLAASLSAPWGADAAGQAPAPARRSSRRGPGPRPWRPCRGRPPRTPPPRRPLAPFLARGAVRRPGGVMAAQGDLFDLTFALAAAGVEPVTVSRPDYVFAADSSAQTALKAATVNFDATVK